MEHYEAQQSKGPPRIIRVPEGVDRKVQLRVDDPRSPYETFSDFAEVAFLNHLELECADLEASQAALAVNRSETPAEGAADWHSASDLASGGSVGEVPTVPELMVPVMDVPATAIAHVEPGHRPTLGHLGFLVNRLNPLPIICRSVARSAPQSFDGILEVVGEPARVVGFRLKADDTANNRSMAERLATSWPVGADADKSINKFVTAYVGDPAHPGAVVQLGLAVWDELDELRLTPLGAELAKCPSPMVDDVEDKSDRLSDEAINVLKQAIVLSQAELDLATLFLEIVTEHSGNQTQVDEELARRMDWSRDVAATTRAALIGRLRDLKIVEVDGRGAKAVISVIDAQPFHGLLPGTVSGEDPG